MLIKTIYNLLTSKKSLLHSDRFLYMAGGGTGTPGGGGTDDQGRPVTADDDQDRQEAPGLDAAEAGEAGEAQARAVAELNTIRNTLEPLTYSSSTEGKTDVFNDYDNLVISVGEHEYYLDYLDKLEKKIKKKGGRWWLPQEGGAADKVAAYVEQISGIARVLKLGNPRLDSVRLGGDNARKEALDAIRDLKEQIKEKREKARKEMLDKLDRTTQDVIEQMEQREVGDEKKDAKAKFIKRAKAQLEACRTSTEPFNKQQKDRLELAKFLHTHDAMLWESEQDQENLEANKDTLTPEGLRARLAQLKARKAAEVDPYLSQISAKANQIEAKIDGKVRSAIERVFKDNPTLLEEHLKRLTEVKKQLASWRNIDYFDIAFGSGTVDMSQLIGSDGDILSAEDLNNKGIRPGALDWIALAETEGISDVARRSALLTASDMLMVADKTMGRPQEVVEMSMEDYDREIDRYITNITEEGEPQGGYTIYFLSLYDFKHMGEKLVEWAKRKYNRRSDNLLGRFGVSLLSDLPGPLKTAANEFDRLKEQSELDEVNQYKESYSNKDAWQVIEVMHNTRNQDEMKACMYLLADLGRIRWDDPQIWRQLMYFGHGAVQFDLANPENEVRNQGRLHEKLQKIVGVIWDFDTFQTWQSTNESNYSSKMQSHKDFCDKTAESEGTLDLVLKQELELYKKDIKAGRVPKIDPQRFEKMIDYNIEWGKGSPEGKLYYLIQGIACGLLSRDTASRFNSNRINAYPVIDIFGSETEAGSKPTMDDIRRWAKLDGDKNEPGKAFLHWFYTDVIHRPRVYQRVDKALTQGMGQDHDDATCWFGAMSANTAQNILSRNAQGFSMPMTGYQNATVGMLQYLDTIMEGYDSMGEDIRSETSGISQIVRFANMFATFDGITAGRMHKDNPTFFKWNGEEERKPRSDGGYKDSYGRKNMTTKNYIDTMRTYLATLEPEFFEFLFKSQTQTPAQIQAFCKKKQDEYKIQDLFGTAGIPKDATTLHQSVGYFLRNILRTPEGLARVRTMRTAVITDHRNFERKKKAESSDFMTVAEKYARDMGSETIATAPGGVNMPQS